MGIIREQLSNQYRFDYKAVFNAFVYGIGDLGWQVLSAMPQSGHIYGKRPGSLMSWGEHITVVMGVLPDGQVRVDVTSEPVVESQFLDYGRNMNNVKKIFNAAHARLGLPAFA